MSPERPPMHVLANATREIAIRTYALSAKTVGTKGVGPWVYILSTLGGDLLTIGLRIAYGSSVINGITKDPFGIPTIMGTTTGFLIAEGIVGGRDRIPMSSIGKATARSLLTLAHRFQQ